MADILITLSLTLQKIFVLFTFIVIGYFISRKGAIPKESAKTLSYLGTNVFFPAYLIENLSTNFTREKLSAKLPLFLWGLVFLACVLIVGFLFTFLFKNKDIPKKTLTYIFAFSNYGYFGYPVMEGVFGKEFVGDTIIFALPTSIAISSVGYFLLMGKGKNFFKTLLSPTIISTVIGCIVGVSGLKLPEIITDILSMGSSCMSPSSMLLTGIVLGKFSLKELFKSPIAYTTSSVRLIAIPAIFAITLMCLGVKGLLFAIPVIITAMPVGMNTVLFTEAGGRDSSESARICFVSYIMGVITIPFAFALANAFMK